jgi:hypothetical protein
LRQWRNGSSSWYKIKLEPACELGVSDGVDAFWYKIKLEPACDLGVSDGVDVFSSS